MFVQNLGAQSRPRWDMSAMSEESDTPERLRILGGHTGTVTALHAEWSENMVLSASLADALLAPFVGFTFNLWQRHCAQTATSKAECVCVRLPILPASGSYTTALGF